MQCPPEGSPSGGYCCYEMQGQTKNLFRHLRETHRNYKRGPGLSTLKTSDLLILPINWASSSPVLIPIAVASLQDSTIFISGGSEISMLYFVKGILLLASESKK